MEQVKDKFDRPLRDIRISLTDQCNFRCSYCMPAEIFGAYYPFLPKEKYLTFAEIVRIVQAAAELGVEKIRLTGGEPLLRKHLSELVHDLYTQTSIKDIALTTNGVLLPKYATALKAAGLQRVNISMDALDDRVFKEMNGRAVGVKAVLKGIEAAKAAGLGIKINMVVKKGINDQQILPMAEHFKKEGIPLRFIEFMDVGSTNGWQLSSVVSKKEIIRLISSQFPIESVKGSYYGEVASRFQYQDGSGEFGVISSVTESFCSTCTRARVSADGKLYTCLFSAKGHDLKPVLRSSDSIKEVKEHIAAIWNQRIDRYSDERTEETAKNRPKIEMSYIGG
ncbi:GTP 3',8-cyclase MoaA [Pseudobacillus badius]|uniref:GTP 3',8-cyclase MoaA n=1 Tax=Bacillus badius TaxID=1455 RepID=UPI003CF09DDB